LKIEEKLVVYAMVERLKDLINSLVTQDREKIKLTQMLIFQTITFFLFPILTVLYKRLFATSTMTHSTIFALFCILLIVIFFHAFLLRKKQKNRLFFILLLYVIGYAITRIIALWFSNEFLLVLLSAIIGPISLSVVPSGTSSEDTFDKALKHFLGERSDSEIDSKKRSRTEVGPSSQFPVGQKTWAEPSAPQVQLGEQSNARVGIQDGQSSEAHPVAQDQIQSESRVRRYFNAHENIGKLIQELRSEERMRIPGGFQLERLGEMFEEKYGGEKLLDIEQEMRQNRRGSSYYQESKTFFDILRRDRATEAVLRKAWQGRG